MTDRASLAALRNMIRRSSDPHINHDTTTRESDTSRSRIAARRVGARRRLGCAEATYAYSKKWEHLCAALALHFAYYNFCRVHRSLRVTPAMEAGITERIWTLRELLVEQG